MLAGVCGGLAMYFAIDPTIVRLVFAIVTLTTGLGLIIYPILWAVMPREPERTPAAFGPIDTIVQPRVSEMPRYERAAVPSERYAFDPMTGEPTRTPTTGSTVSLGKDAVYAEQQPYAAQQPIYDAPPLAQQPSIRRKRLNWVGIVLVGFGAMILADQLGINTDIIFPIILMAIGGLLIWRRS